MNISPLFLREQEARPPKDRPQFYRIGISPKNVWFEVGVEVGGDCTVAGKIGTKGRRYTIDGVRVPPKQLVARSAFKLMNLVTRWAETSNPGALDRVEHWIEERALNLGVKMLRAPHEYTFWRKGSSARVTERQARHLIGKTLAAPEEDFWATPKNYTHVVDLTQKPGGTFKLSKLEKKVLKKQCRLGIKHGIVWDKPFLWTIKHYEPGYGDPRQSQEEANIWNEHYLAAVGRHITKLREELGYVPFLNEIANEFNTVHPHLTVTQIGDICARWHKRDAFEIIGIDQAGPPVDRQGNEVPYIPELDAGARSPDDIRMHPARDRELPWWDIGKYVEQYFGHYKKPVYIDEPILLMPKVAYDALPKGHPWRSLGTKSKKHYAEMVEDLWSRGFYVCFHDGGNDAGSMHGGGVSAGYVPRDQAPDQPGEIDAFIKELIGS